MKNVLIILGHPDKESFNGAIARAYAQEAEKQGAQVKLLYLGDLQFDPILRLGYKSIQPLEPDLQNAWEMIQSAAHMVWVYPSWWGSMPALLKGFCDRVLLPGQAFKYKENSPMWHKYLIGKSARIVLTMDAPYLWNWFVYHNANIHALKKATLEFCGIKPVKVKVFDRIRFRTQVEREKMLLQVQAFAQRDLNK